MVPTPDGIMQLGLGFWGSKTLLSAVELGLFTELANGSLDARTLSERFMLHPRSDRDFLDALVALGMLERDGERYANTSETDLFLDREKPSYLGGLLEMANAWLYPFWGSLTEALRTGQPQNEAKGEEENVFAAIYADPNRLEGFLTAMTGISRARPRRSQRSSRGTGTKLSWTLERLRVRCRFRWLWPTTTSRVADWTCRLSVRSSSSM